MTAILDARKTRTSAGVSGEPLRGIDYSEVAILPLRTLRSFESRFQQKGMRMISAVPMASAILPHVGPYGLLLAQVYPMAILVVAAAGNNQDGPKPRGPVADGAINRAWNF